VNSTKSEVWNIWLRKSKEFFDRRFFYTVSLFFPNTILSLAHLSKSDFDHMVNILTFHGPFLSPAFYTNLQREIR